LPKSINEQVGVGHASVVAVCANSTDPSIDASIDPLDAFADKCKQSHDRGFESRPGCGF
jgi:hypothetical protein